MKARGSLCPWFILPLSSDFNGNSLFRDNPVTWCPRRVCLVGGDITALLTPRSSPFLNSLSFSKHQQPSVMSEKWLDIFSWVKCSGCKGREKPLSSHSLAEPLVHPGYKAGRTLKLPEYRSTAFNKAPQV